MRAIVVAAALCFAAARTPAIEAQPPAATETVTIDATAHGTPLPHFWEHIFGSGRAILTLREGYRTDLTEVKRSVGLEYVRFHAIFHDEVGIYNEDKQGNAFYNFSYFDQIYDGLLQQGVRPYVELSFMPKKLSVTPPVVHPFWYAPIVSPPKDWNRWDDLMTAFARHLIQRYGIEEVSKWYFEVWNEPNIDFWAGDPKYDTYIDLYDHTARALKAVDLRLRVGGPSTAQAAWVDIFLKHVSDAKVPIDFVSTHVYGNEKSQHVFGTDEVIPRDQMVCRAVRKVHDQVKASFNPQLPLIFSEYNASYANEPTVTDTTYMGPWLGETLRQCDGFVDEMAFWTFSDVFEEQGVVKTPFYGGFGLIAERSIPKPVFNAFRLLHRLGTVRLPAQSSSVFASRRSDGSLAVLAWNLVPPGEQGPEKTITLDFKGVKGRKATIWKVDDEHGNVLKLYNAMGAPKSPTMAQIKQLQSAAQLPPPEDQALEKGALTLHVPAHGLVLVEVQ